MSTTILIVEDDRAISHLLSQALGDDGFSVMTAAHGREALDILETTRPDAIVLDLQMPVMDGRTFMGHLRHDQRRDVREIPVLILSAHGAATARRELGAEASVNKPFDIDSVSRTLAQLVNAGSRPPRANLRISSVKTSAAS